MALALARAPAHAALFCLLCCVAALGADDNAAALASLRPWGFASKAEGHGVAQRLLKAVSARLSRQEGAFVGR